MQDMMLSGPPRLLERREKWMKTLQVAVDRKESIMHDKMLSGPPRLLVYYIVVSKV